MSRVRGYLSAPALLMKSLVQRNIPFLVPKVLCILTPSASAYPSRGMTIMAGVLGIVVADGAKRGRNDVGITTMAMCILGAGIHTLMHLLKAAAH